MKVLLVSPLPPPSGGMAKWTQLYISGVDNHNINVRVVNTNLSKKRSLAKNRSITLTDEFKRFCRIISDFRAAIKEFCPDIIHICSPCSRNGLLRDYICVVLSKKTPIIFHCHCNIEDQATSSLGIFLFKRIVYKSKKIFVLNESSKSFVDSISNNKAVLIPNFIEESKLSNNHYIRDKIENVVFVGHVKKKKGILEIYHVAKETPSVSFNIYGPIMELPDEERPENLYLHGEVPNDRIFEILEDADVFLFPSYTEGFANVMLEAMAAGLPIIASNVGANKEMIENQGGIIVDPHSVKQIINALNIMSSPFVRSRMSKWNINRIASDYSLRRGIELIENQYLEIV